MYLQVWQRENDPYSFFFFFLLVFAKGWGAGKDFFSVLLYSFLYHWFYLNALLLFFSLLLVFFLFFFTSNLTENTCLPTKKKKKNRNKEKIYLSPPLTSMVCPLKKLDIPTAIMVSATSSAVPHLPNVDCFKKASR